MNINAFNTFFFSLFSLKGFALQKLLSTKFLEIFFSILKTYSPIFASIISFIIININFFDTTKTFYLAYKLRSQLLLEHGFSIAEIFSPEVFFLHLEEFIIFNQIFSFLYLFVWKFLFAVLMIIPVLLIVAYSTLLE
jgi:hypothetical protein